MDFEKINWFGLAGGIATLALVILSIVYASPWWQLTVGKEAGQANVSPLSFNINVLGSQIVIPLIWFLNLAAQLSFATSAIAIIFYSVLPRKSYSKHLLGFAYKKPLITLVIFLVSLFLVTYFAGNLLHVNIPLAGSTTLTLNVENVTMEIPIASGFTWVFWLAVIGAGLCIAARFYHRRIASASAAKT